MGVLGIAVIAMWAAAAVLFAYYAATVAGEVTYVTLADGRRQERSIPVLFKMLLPFAPNFYPLIRRPFFRVSVEQADSLLIQGGFEGLITGEEFTALRLMLLSRDAPSPVDPEVAAVRPRSPDAECRGGHGLHQRPAAQLQAAAA